MTVKELIKLIEQWAIDRQLDKYGTVEGQLIKTSEEVAELIIAISKDDVEAIKDAVGDVFVTLVVGNMLDSKLDVGAVYELVVAESRMRVKRKFDLVYYLVSALKHLLYIECYKRTTFDMVLECLLDVCSWYELDFTKCVESAYSEIANRKGMVVGGSFVKEERVGFSVRN